ncbi:MAG: hypothetical protein M3R05_03435 [Chloroflexota bacterium]|nr:hypothetical protein [Chloroflexota bacterium]
MRRAVGLSAHPGRARRAAADAPMSDQSARVETRPNAGPAPGTLVPTGAIPPYEAVIFDMNGVVTDTAAVHAAAWKELFDAALTDARGGLAGPEEPFDAVADYRRYVDGRSREDGVTAFLAARGVKLTRGDPDDPPDAWSVHGLGKRENDIYGG